jgi:hypothetical protein
VKRGCSGHRWAQGMECSYYTLTAGLVCKSGAAVVAVDSCGGDWWCVVVSCAGWASWAGVTAAVGPCSSSMITTVWCVVVVQLQECAGVHWGESCCDGQLLSGVAYALEGC